MVTAHEQKPTERADLRDALLAAADRLMRERGARGLTTREIAREAGCSDGALYVHFQDKAHLLAAVSRVADQLTVAQVHNEVHQFQRDLTDQDRNLVGNFHDIHAASTSHDGETHSIKHLDLAGPDCTAPEIFCRKPAVGSSRRARDSR